MLCLNSWFMSQLEDDLAKNQYTKQKIEKRVKRQINGFNTLYNSVTGKKGKLVGSLADLDMLLIPVNQNNSHWLMVVLDLRQRHVFIVNSMGTGK